ncbi:hypothetical protein RRG08_062151 [Elysia crispata]|uniref:Uncharacterized protein n=1 Tax=Elysia crispata TaxID=231223 RepID=A0AAE1CXE7_9GAST|nr:hypothetical protein RRG08_062151 [Elysia crispata]
MNFGPAVCRPISRPDAGELNAQSHSFNRSGPTPDPQSQPSTLDSKPQTISKSTPTPGSSLILVLNFVIVRAPELFARIPSQQQ